MLSTDIPHEKMWTVSTSLSGELYVKWKTILARLGQKPSVVMRDLIVDFVAREEEYAARIIAINSDTLKEDSEHV